MGRAHMEHIRHIPGLFAVKINPFQHQPFLLGQTGQRLMQLLGQHIGLGLFSHRCSCIHQLGLQKIRISAGGIHTSQIRASFLTQEVQHTPPYAMHSIKTEGYTPPGLIAFHCLNESYGSLLDHIHDVIQLAEGQRLFEHKGLISLDEPVPGLFILLFLEDMPKMLLFLRFQKLYLIQFLQIFTQSHPWSPPHNTD